MIFSLVPSIFKHYEQKQNLKIFELIQYKARPAGIHFMIPPSTLVVNFNFFFQVMGF